MTTTRTLDAAGLLGRVAAGDVRSGGVTSGNVPGGHVPWGDADWQSMPRGELLAAHRELAALRRRVDAVLAAASAEVAHRSQTQDGVAGLARREGFASPERLVAAATGGSTAEAARLIEVGRASLDAAPVLKAGAALEAGTAGGGQGDDTAGPRLAVLAQAVADGRVSIDAASAISTMLRRVAPVADPAALREAEAELVARATSLPLDRLAAVIRQCEARLDREGRLRRQQAHRESRYLHVAESRTGMVIIDGRLDAQTAAPLRAALDGLVADSLRRRRDDTGPLADTRTAPQMRADALADLGRHALGCEARDLPLNPTTAVVVRMNLDDLRAKLDVEHGTGPGNTEGRGEWGEIGSRGSISGWGSIDGTDEPISAGDVRRMAAAADIIPMVLGGDSEILDLGRTRRLFTKAQRLALVERDGGCAWCHAPPSWTEAHHIRWWERDTGPTDLSNGILLCASCHHRIHRDNWGIDVRDDGTVWFVPPRSVDPQRTPIQGGRARFADTRQQNHSAGENDGAGIAENDGAGIAENDGAGIAGRASRRDDYATAS